MTNTTKPARLSGLRIPISSQKHHAAKADDASESSRSGARLAETWDRSRVMNALTASATAPTLAFTVLGCRSRCDSIDATIALLARAGRSYARGRACRL